MFDYELVIAIASGRNWDNTGPKWVHYLTVQLGDHRDTAIAKATTLREALGTDQYTYRLSVTPRPTSTELVNW